MSHAGGDDWGRTRRRVIRASIGALGAVVLLNIAGYLLDSASGARRGPESSSYTTSATGLAAYADLLARAGHPIQRLRAEVTEAPPHPDATLVLLDPGPATAAEARSLAAFVDDGGRLVTGGHTAPEWLEETVVEPPEWSPSGGDSAGVAAPTPEVAGVGEVAADGTGSWSDPASGLPVLAADGTPIVTAETVGEGRVVMLADTSILHNELLDDSDNAAVGLRMAGEAGRPVVFAESVHGYGQAEGLGAIPQRWLWTLGGIFLATLVYMVARGRRLGPPEDTARPLPPPRRAYADALGGILARTRDSVPVAARMREAIRRRILARSGLPRSASAADIQRSAEALGLGKEEVRALGGSEGSEDDLVTLGRALAKLESHHGEAEMSKSSGIER